MALAQVTERISVGPGGIESPDGGDLPYPGTFVSAGGRFVLFRSTSNNLVPGDTYPSSDLFVRDRLTQVTELVSVDLSGVPSGGYCGLYGCAISADGRYVAFYSEANDLVSGDTNGYGDIFVRDRQLGTTERVNIATSGAQANSFSHYPAITPDGRFVTFESPATTIVRGDTNGFNDVFVRDRLTSTTERVSIGIGGVPTDGDSGGTSSISDDGRVVSFASDATNLVPGDFNAVTDAFVFDRWAGTTEIVSVSSAGVAADDWNYEVAISGNGRCVVFTSNATNLAAGDTNGYWDVYMHDRATGMTVLCNMAAGGIAGNGQSQSGKLSNDGRFVSFRGGATNLFPGQYVPGWIFVHDLWNGSMEAIALSTDGQYLIGGSAGMPTISPDGRYVAFRSSATNLVPGDTNANTDVFVRDRLASGFTSLCDPGLAGTIPCPCQNAPLSAGRGCDNSSATGGASLSATGLAYLAQDSLTFTTSGQKPSSTSILLQGSALLPSGVAFGQGVRCAGGTLKRLYVKAASAGSITAPDPGASDLSISARSAQLGLALLPGIPYTYLVYYRDANVLGGCPASGTFNATQTGLVSWWP